MDTTSSRTDATLPADPDEVWEVLTSPDGVESWLGDGSSLAPVEGAELDVADVETGVRRRGRVEIVDPGRRIGFVWWPAGDAGDGDDAGDGGAGSASRVEVVLSPVDGGTRLVITETPLTSMSASASIGPTAGRSEPWAWRSAAVELALVGPRVGSGLAVAC